MGEWSPKSSQSSRLTSYMIEEETIEANTQISIAEEIQTNNINLVKNKRTISHRNHLKTKTTPYQTIIRYSIRLIKQ